MVFYPELGFQSSLFRFGEWALLSFRTDLRLTRVRDSEEPLSRTSWSPYLASLRAFLLSTSALYGELEQFSTLVIVPVPAFCPFKTPVLPKTENESNQELKIPGL